MRILPKAAGYLLPAIALSLCFAAQASSAQEPEQASAQEQSTVPENLCLRSNQIDNWEAMDDRTLIVTDRRDRKFKVGVVGACTGLDRALFSLALESASPLSCVRSGDRIHYNDPTFGPERCTISSVEPYTPADEGTDGTEG